MKCRITQNHLAAQSNRHGTTWATQARVAELADIDVRTVLNIENFKDNPKFEVQYPLIRALHIDAQTVFYP